jgi:hypothetical protein
MSNFSQAASNLALISCCSLFAHNPVLCRQSRLIADSYESVRSYSLLGLNTALADQQQAHTPELCREHLEGLEDKLREYKTAVSDPKMYDDKVKFPLQCAEAYSASPRRSARGQTTCQGTPRQGEMRWATDYPGLHDTS